MGISIFNKKMFNIISAMVNIYKMYWVGGSGEGDNNMRGNLTLKLGTLYCEIL